MLTPFAGMTHYHGPAPKVLQAVKTKPETAFLTGRFAHKTEGLILTNRDLADFTETKLQVTPPVPLLEALEEFSPLLTDIRKKGRYEQALFHVDILRKKKAFFKDIKEAFQARNMNAEQQHQLFMDYYHEVKKSRQGKDLYGKPIEEVQLPFLEDHQ